MIVVNITTTNYVTPPMLDKLMLGNRVERKA